MSIASLRERLQNISKKTTEENTFDITDPKKWMKGEEPEDWLEFIEHVRDNVVFTSKAAKHECLSDLCSKALVKALDSSKYRNNEAYAVLFVVYGRCKSTFMPDDAVMIFNQARVISRKFAIVHCASAQLELERGNRDRAKKILEKALLFDVKPREDVEVALRKLRQGETNIFTSPTSRQRNHSGQASSTGSRKGSGSDVSCELTDNISANLSSNVSFSMCTSSKNSQSQKPEPPSSAIKPAQSLPEPPSSSIKPAQSLPEPPSSTIKPAQSLPAVNLAPFQRPNIQTESANNPVPGHNRQMADLPINVDMVSVDDKLSPEAMSTTSSSNLSGSTTKPGAGRLTFDGGQSISKQPSRLPLDSSVHKHGLRTFRSTPLLGSERRRPCTAPPGRVKMINKPFEPMNVQEEEEETMNTMDSFKPLDKSTAGFNAHHTSGYLSMVSDSTIPMETKTFDKPKMEPVVEREEVSPPQPPAAPVVTPSDPCPAIQAPPVPTPAPIPVRSGGLEVPQTPKNTIIPPTTPLSNMNILTVNDVQYAVLSVLGKGGSSKVFQAFDDQTKKIRAIKEVNLDNANSAVVEGYKNEIALLKRLQYCDKVIKMYDSEYKKEINKLYVVMEAGSEDLATFFHRETQNRKPLSDSVTWFYWERMLLAVQALHREGIIHSDLKPANFLLVGGNLKLIDFGIAKALQQDKTSVILETQIGTINFMSPETIMQQQGEGRPKFKIGVRSDVWSLGCILYNMVYGRTPFQHIRNDLFKLQAIINPDLPIDFPDIPNKNLLDVMKRCLQRDPKLRPSIDELLDHPYLKSNQEDQVTPPKAEKMNKRMEALVSTLASQFACSPGGLRNLIHATIDNEQESIPPGLEKVPQARAPTAMGKHISSAQYSSNPAPQVKKLRTPLTSLNVDFKHPT
ncbi:dual specificity protein kinase TTK-like isoform X2 [Mya arenaria]|uniref:dual specificity protein kinase TTK-like isoform X2 n=1 Tax=Mya arenaria TaxID=6604 RepID=UPI0022E434DE|nr:dual specificity protein kinase TTK-like isoform X2 [Mya arenaria]XP_052807734.1 dual specificity protein kinase TTK-like isoform X2 [Mya arenaria]